MPRLEKLAESYKNQPDVVFLSMNMDDDPGLVEPFAKEKKLTFTILPAYDYVTETLKVNGIPQNWIIAPDGMIRLKGTGYDATEKWEAGMRNAIAQFLPHEAAAKAAPSAAAPAPAAAASGNSGGSPNR